jgi:hypothetical protein
VNRSVRDSRSRETVPRRLSAILLSTERMAQYILRHLGAWHDPPPRPPPEGLPGPYTYEPCQDADPIPDYENVLTE